MIIIIIIIIIIRSSVILTFMQLSLFSTGKATTGNTSVSAGYSSVDSPLIAPYDHRHLHLGQNPCENRSIRCTNEKVIKARYQVI